jgi:hypothetical protein
MSFRTLGTSPKKKMAKMPAETPKPAAMEPYRTALGMVIPQKLGKCFVLLSMLVGVCHSSARCLGACEPADAGRVEACLT